MEDSERGDLRKQLEEREAEVGELREQLEQAEEEIDRLQHENEQLRTELKAAGRGPKGGPESRKPKPNPKRPGRKAGQGQFTNRKAPSNPPAAGPPVAL